MDTVYIVDKIYKIIRARQNQITQIIINNQVKDWNDYQNHLGQLDTLNYIEQELSDLLKKKQEQNE
jgi:tRNA-dihydrouridine synthase|tara:strand:- start:848 stop:1045 length:198 start_codon:yes stop_codon:yes gene_type:complete